ncbi:hypothetical protein KKA27_03930 [Patescibacteria group bacterium]|nr:hypothetical protein [Patescibacteria group bacterium]MBU2633105.1 hypothetical protein [Patescibacteria group bacterium]
MGIFLKIELWEKYQKSLFMALFLIALVFGFSYVYFMNLAVLKTAERNDNLDKLSEAKMQFQGLETEYINKLEKLNVSYAKSLGFVEAEPDDYIYKQKTVAQTNGYVRSIR